MMRNCVFLLDWLVVVTFFLLLFVVVIPTASLAEELQQQVEDYSSVRERKAVTKKPKKHRGRSGRGSNGSLLASSAALKKHERLLHGYESSNDQEYRLWWRRQRLRRRWPRQYNRRRPKGHVVFGYAMSSSIHQDPTVGSYYSSSAVTSSQSSLASSSPLLLQDDEGDGGCGSDEEGSDWVGAGSSQYAIGEWNVVSKSKGVKGSKTSNMGRRTQQRSRKRKSGKVKSTKGASENYYYNYYYYSSQVPPKGSSKESGYLPFLIPQPLVNPTTPPSHIATSQPIPIPTNQPSHRVTSNPIANPTNQPSQWITTQKPTSNPTTPLALPSATAWPFSSSLDGKMSAAKMSKMRTSSKVMGSVVVGGGGGGGSSSSSSNHYLHHSMTRLCRPRPAPKDIGATTKSPLSPVAVPSTTPFPYMPNSNLTSNMTNTATNTTIMPPSVVNTTAGVITTNAPVQTQTTMTPTLHPVLNSTSNATTSITAVPTTPGINNSSINNAATPRPSLSSTARPTRKNNASPTSSMGVPSTTAGTTHPITASPTMMGAAMTVPTTQPTLSATKLIVTPVPTDRRPTKAPLRLTSIPNSRPTSGTAAVSPTYSPISKPTSDSTTVAPMIDPAASPKPTQQISPTSSVVSSVVPSSVEPPTRQPHVSEEPTGGPGKRERPTRNPESYPTDNPTVTAIPSLSVPSVVPPAVPSVVPPVVPSVVPPVIPTSDSTFYPTVDSTFWPSVDPTSSPTGIPIVPSLVPPVVPSVVPPAVPSVVPPVVPSVVPSVIPTSSNVPTPYNSFIVDDGPTSFPTNGPTSVPTYVPTVSPTTSPTGSPTFAPTGRRGSAPSVAARMLGNDGGALSSSMVLPTFTPNPSGPPTDFAGPTIGSTVITSPGPTVEPSFGSSITISPGTRYTGQTADSGNTALMGIGPSESAPASTARSPTVIDAATPSNSAAARAFRDVSVTITKMQDKAEKYMGVPVSAVDKAKTMETNFFPLVKAQIDAACSSESSLSSLSSCEKICEPMFSRCCKTSTSINHNDNSDGGDGDEIGMGNNQECRFDTVTRGCVSYSKCIAAFSAGDGRRIDPAPALLPLYCEVSALEKDPKPCQELCQQHECCYAPIMNKSGDHEMKNDRGDDHNIVTMHCLGDKLHICLDYAPCQNLRIYASRGGIPTDRNKQTTTTTTTTTTTKTILLEPAPPNLDQLCLNGRPDCELACRKAKCCNLNNVAHAEKKNSQKNSKKKESCFMDNVVSCLTYAACSFSPLAEEHHAAHDFSIPLIDLPPQFSVVPKVPLDLATLCEEERVVGAISADADADSDDDAAVTATAARRRTSDEVFLRGKSAQQAQLTPSDTETTTVAAAATTCAERCRAAACCTYFPLVDDKKDVSEDDNNHDEKNCFDLDPLGCLAWDQACQILRYHW